MTETPPATSIVPAEQSPRANGISTIRVVQDAVPTLDTARFEHMQRLATIMADSSLVPETLRKTGSGDNKTDLPRREVVANCFLLVNQAVRWGMDPFAVAQCCSVVHGRLCYEGKLVHAVLEQKLGVRLAYDFDNAAGDKLGVTVSGLLPGETALRTVQGTVVQWKTTGANSPWTSSANWKRQLRYRGAREWARAHAPAVLLGVYSDDEMDDLVARNAHDITPRQHALPRPKGPPPAPIVDLTAEPATPPARQVVAPAKEVAKKPAKIEPFPPDLLTDPASYLDHLDGEMAAASDKAALDEVWLAHLESTDGRLKSEDERKAEALYERHGKRKAEQ